MIAREKTAVEATVTQVFFPRTGIDFKGGFCIWGTDAGKMKGTMPFYPKHGMKLKFTGRYEEYKGELQFAVERVDYLVPEDKQALLAYVCSLASGIGEKTYQAIWEKFGEDWEANVDRLPLKVCNSIKTVQNGLATNRDRTQTITYLISIGGTPRMGELAFAKWGERAIAAIESDPYILTQVEGIGFKTVDTRLRAHFNIGDTDPRRVTAAIDYCINDIMEGNGNTLVTRSDLLARVEELGIPHNETCAQLANKRANGAFIYCGMEAITTAECRDQELAIMAYALGSRAPSPAVAVKKITMPDKIKLDDSQLSAIRFAISRPGLSVINGGAGSGKTTIIKTIFETLRDASETVQMCAFAGKAAARLREATGHDASTIHSMLGWRGEGTGFSTSTLNGVTVIVDEASMVPSWLMYEIVKRSPFRLILVGDQAQIQPVGLGQPFHDIVRFMPQFVNTLTTCYRNKEAVFMAATKIREGHQPEADSVTEQEEFHIVHVGNAADAQNKILQLVRGNKLDFEKDLLLSPRNGDTPDQKATVNALNAEVQSIVNPHGKNEKFLSGDRVMCVRNFPAAGLWNGTTGWITRVDIEGRPFFHSDDPVDGNDNEQLLKEKEQRQAIVPAYCLTVHKAQGSQYRNVYIVALKRDAATLLDRSLLYTAVTRAKHACTIFTDCGLASVVNHVNSRKTYFQFVVKGAKTNG